MSSIFRISMPSVKVQISYLPEEILSHRQRALAVAYMALSVLAACTSLRHSGHAPPAEPTIVEVQNQGFPDMDVYIVDGSRRVRIGFAPGHTTTELTIQESLVSGGRELRFICDPIGSNSKTVSREIFVDQGDKVLLIIPPS